MSFMDMTTARLDSLLSFLEYMMLGLQHNKRKKKMVDFVVDVGKFMFYNFWTFKYKLFQQSEMF